MADNGEWYVAHRLFAAHDRLLGAQVANSLLKAGYSVFLPFCDSNESVSTRSAEGGRRIYERDLYAMQRMAGVVALLHGPTLDDGVGFEVGYAVGLGLPVIGVSTDFQSVELCSPSVTARFSDPLVETCLDALVDIPLGPSSGNSSTREEHLSEYVARNVEQLSRVCVGILDAVGGQRSTRLPPDPADAPTGWYWETRPGQDPEACLNLGGVSHGLRSRIPRLRLPNRWLGTTPTDVSSRSREDLGAALASELLIVDVDDIIVPVGAAIMAGIATAIGLPLYAIQRDQRKSLAPQREANKFNLMVHYSCRDIVSSAEALLDLLLG